MRRGYIRDAWEFPGSREIEEKHTGRYGAKGQKRETRKKASPEDIVRQNQWKKVRDLRRLIKWNFGERDYWITITYQKGTRPSYQEMKKDMENLIRTVRRKYGKYGIELRYIKRFGIGKRGGPHMHILVNRFANEETGTDLIFSESWKKGHINFKTTYDLGGYQQLAEYIAKPLEAWEPEELKRYSPSRNLTRKEAETKIIHKRSLTDYPKAPKGYYVDPESVKMGKNPITGYLYRHYTLVKLDRRI